jgi:hypothetical protein
MSRLPAKIRTRHRRDCIPSALPCGRCTFPGDVAEARGPSQAPGLRRAALPAARPCFPATCHHRRASGHSTRYRRVPPSRVSETLLPFVLTDDQLTAVDEILGDMSSSSRPMNRMLLGDVGTGKTAVAAHALAAVADTGTQAAMMAPTEVLAVQYAERVGPSSRRGGDPVGAAHRFACRQARRSARGPSNRVKPGSSSGRMRSSRKACVRAAQSRHRRRTASLRGGPETCASPERRPPQICS